MPQHSALARSRPPLDDEGPSLDAVEQGEPGAGVEPAVGPVPHLDQAGGRDDERLGGGLEQVPAGGVVGVAADVP